MTYYVTVRFQREECDDADVIGKPLNQITTQDLKEQFRKELQHAYDSEDSALAGLFTIEEITEPDWSAASSAVPVKDSEFRGVILREELPGGFQKFLGLDDL